MGNELRERLDRLEQLLSPKTLDERFEAFVLRPRWEFYTPAPKHENDRHVDVQAEIEKMTLELKTEHDRLRTSSGRRVLAKARRANLGTCSSGPDSKSITFRG